MVYGRVLPETAELMSTASVAIDESRDTTTLGSCPRLAGRSVTGTSACGWLSGRPGVPTNVWYPATTASVAATAHGIAADWYHRLGPAARRRQASDAVMSVTVARSAPLPISPARDAVAHHRAHAHIVRAIDAGEVVFLENGALRLGHFLEQIALRGKVLTACS